MATISRFSAVAKVGKFEFGGFIAWLAWLVLHLYYLVGYRNRFTTVIAWFIRSSAEVVVRWRSPDRWSMHGWPWRIWR